MIFCLRVDSDATTRYPRRMVFLLAFYDAFYIAPAKAKRAAATEAAKGAKRSGSAVSVSADFPGSATSSGGGRRRANANAVDSSSGGVVASPDRKE